MMTTPKTALKRTFLAATALLALGGAVRYGHGGLAGAQTNAPVVSTVPVFSGTHARTENERNTVTVVRSAQDGLVYIRVQSGKTGTAPFSSKEPGYSDPFTGTPFAGLPFGQGGLPDGQNQPQHGTGSGFFVDARGDILTNYHVVEGADTLCRGQNGFMLS